MGLSKKGRYVACLDCGCRLEMNGVCKICGHADVPLLAGMVPDILGFPQPAANAMLTNPECQLVLGTVETTNHETIPDGMIIQCEPAVGTQLAIGSPVNIVISLGPES